LDCSPSAIYIKDLHGRYQFINKKFEDLSGFKKKDVISKTDFELFPESVAQNSTKDDRRVIETGTMLETEEFAPVEDRMHTFITTKSPLINEDDGKIYEICGVSKDITKRKQAEEALRESEKKYQYLVEFTDDLVWSIDIKGIHTFINRSVEQQLGYKVGEIIGSDSLQLIHPDDKDIIQKILQESADHKKGWSDLIIRWIHKDGSIRYFEGSGHPIFDVDDNLTGFNGIDRDITDRKQAEERSVNKKIKLKDTLKERIKELGCFYGVSYIIEKHNGDYKKILQGIVDLLPSALHSPEITCAKIVINNEEIKTNNYKNTRWKQVADIKIDSRTVDFIEIAYTIEMPTLDGGPFLKEEIFLLNSLAERVGNATIRIRAEEELRLEKIALESKNIALKEVLSKVQEEKEEIAMRVQANVDKIIMPIFSILEKNTSFKETHVLNLLKKNLEEVTAPFTNAISKEFLSLSPVEIQICNYIKNGFSTKDVAQLRGIAIATVNRHREHIRKKLNLTNKNINLVTYLNNFKMK